MKKAVSGRLAAIQRAFVLKWSESLRDEVIRHCGTVQGPPRAESFLSPVGKSRQIGLLLLCLLIYTIALGIAVFGIALVVTASHVWHYAAGLFLLAIAWFARPRKSPEPDRPLDPARYPAIHEVVNRVAQALDSPSIQTVSVPPTFNASYYETQGGKRRHVALGSLLAAALTEDERIAVIAHEVSHGVNRDMLRDRWVHGAIETLYGWALAVRPLSVGRSADDMPRGALLSVALIPFELLQLAMSECLFLGVKMIYLLAMKQSQQAEFFADLLATRAAGSVAMISALERLHQFPTIELVIQHAHLADQDSLIEPKILAAIQSMPESVAEGYRHRAREERWQEDATHPPTASRLDVLRAVPAQSPMIGLDEPLRVAFRTEISQLVEAHKREYFEQRMLALGY